jgi:hypothetical protein
MCRRAPSRRRMWFIKRTRIRDFYEHAMWERCQPASREHGCNFRSAPGLTADSGFLQRFCCWVRTAKSATGAGRGSSVRCAFWYVDVGVQCATSPRPFEPRPLARAWLRQLSAARRMQQWCNTRRSAPPDQLPTRVCHVALTRRARSALASALSRAPANRVLHSESRDPNGRRARMTAVQRRVALRRCACAARTVQS